MTLIKRIERKAEIENDDEETCPKCGAEVTPDELIIADREDADCCDERCPYL